MFYLRIFENFRYPDEDDSYDHGSFSTYEEAERSAKSIVDEFLEHNWSRGMKPDILLAQFAL